MAWLLRKTPLAFPKKEFPHTSTHVQHLSVTMKHRFDMPWEDAVAVAKMLEELFNGRREVDDDSLSKELRAMFYDLQSKDMLRIRREEYRSSNGKVLRAFYWRINEEIVSRTDAIVDRTRQIKEAAVGNVYENLPEEVWARAS